MKTKYFSHNIIDSHISQHQNLDYKIPQLEEILAPLPLLTDEEAEGKRGEVTHSRSHSMTKAGLSSCPPMWFYYALCLLTYYSLG